MPLDLIGWIVVILIVCTFGVRFEWRLKVAVGTLVAWSITR